MKTQDEIAARMVAIQKIDMLGFGQEALAEWLDYEHAKPFLKDGTTEAEWQVTELTRENLIERMRYYMEFAWEKVKDERGISANRSVGKFREWLWILGERDTFGRYEDTRYHAYGAPHLTVVCEALGFPIPSMATS